MKVLLAIVLFVVYMSYLVTLRENTVVDVYHCRDSSTGEHFNWLYLAEKVNLSKVRDVYCTKEKKPNKEVWKNKDL